MNKKTADFYANDIVYSKKGINFCISSKYGKKISKQNYMEDTL